MLAQLALPLLLALGVSAAPTRRGDDGDLKCVQQQYIGPFTSTGLNGWIHFYANVTDITPDSDYTFKETRLGISDDGTLQNCGDCRSTQQFGFEVCQGPDRKGFAGLGNSASEFYGHILYTTDQADVKCLTATQPFNGSSITAEECQYDYENAGASGQYWSLTISDDGSQYPLAFLVTDYSGPSFGVNPDVDNEGGKVTLWKGTASDPFTYFGFKAPVF